MGKAIRDTIDMITIIILNKKDQHSEHTHTHTHTHTLSRVN